jgi:hypothetical protein
MFANSPIWMQNGLPIFFKERKPRNPISHSSQIFISSFYATQFFSWVPKSQLKIMQGDKSTYQKIILVANRASSTQHVKPICSHPEIEKKITLGRSMQFGAPTFTDFVRDKALLSSSLQCKSPQ